MTKFFITLTSIFIFSLTTFHGFAQRTGGGMPAGAGAGGGKMPALVGRIYGKIVDATTNQPIPYASVIAARPLGKRDTIVGGMLTLENGDFNLDNLPMGGVKIKISVLGYKDYVKSATLFPPDMEVDLGDLKIQVDAQILGEVTVSAEKSGMVMSLDKKTFNVDKNITSTGGTAEDVLKNVPSLSVDADGGVKLRNNNTTIYVDGRPTVLSLNQIPSDQIESVEVISNPSAKYEASTSGGIVNIVLKKNRAPGYNGFIGLGVGTNNRYDATANLNVKAGRFNVTSFFSYRSSMVPTDAYTLKTIFNPAPGVAPNYYQNSHGVFDNNFKIGRLAVDYSVNNRNTLTLAGTIVSGVFDFNVDQNNYFLNVGLDTIQYGPRKILPRNNFTQHQAQASWKKTFPKKGKELSADLNYGWGNSNNAQTWYNTLYNKGGTLIQGYPDTTLISGGSNGSQLVFQTDFTNPINDSTKLEAGGRSSWSNRIQNTFVDDLKNGVPTRLSFLSSDYNISDYVNAAYITYSSRWKGINYQAGVRYEQSNLSGKPRSESTQSFGYNYPGANSSFFNALFPSLYLSKKLDANNEIQANFSRKINRPNFMQIIPAIFGSDAQNITKGNPALKPEFINLFEVNYNKLFGPNNWISSLYLRNTNDPITTFSSSNPDVAGGLINTYINGKVSNTYGWENTVKYNIVNNLDLTANLNVFNINLSSDTITKQGWSYSAKSSLAYKFLKGFSTQLSANYEAKQVNLQGYREGFGWMDFAVKKSFFGGAASITFQVNDIFNSRKFITVLDQPGYYQESLRRRDVRYYKLSVQFPFGKIDSSIFRKAKDAKKQQGQQQDQPDYNGQ